MMKYFAKLLIVFVVVIRTIHGSTGALTTESPSSQKATTEKQADGTNGATEGNLLRPESPEDVDVSGLSPEECIVQISLYFPEEHDYAACKCMHLFCPVDEENAPQTPEDVDVSGLYGEACMLKILGFFPDVDVEYLACKCVNMGCPNQTEEELENAQKRFKQYYDAVHESGDDIYLGVIYVLVMLVGTVGNLLVLVTVLKVFKSPTVTNMFITSLALADLLIVLICIPFRLTDYVGKQIWDLGEATCKVIQYVYVFSFMCSVFTLTAMSLERYLVICYPMKAVSMSTPGRAKKIIAVVWVTAAVLAIPSGLISGVFSFECEMVLLPRHERWDDYYFFFLLLVIFFVPSALMAFAYGRTGYVLWQSILHAKELKGEKAKDSEKATMESRARLQVIRMLIMIWILFTLTWGSFLCYQMININRYRLIFAMDGEHMTRVDQTLNLLTMANSAINPILYAFMSSQFRKGFIKCLSCIPIVKRKYLPPVTTTTGSTAKATGISSISASVNT